MMRKLRKAHSDGSHSGIPVDVDPAEGARSRYLRASSKGWKLNHVFARLRVRALGMAAKLMPAPTPFMFTGPGSSVELVQMIANRGARSALVVTDAVLLGLKVVDPVLVSGVRTTDTDLTS